MFCAQVLVVDDALHVRVVLARLAAALWALAAFFFAEAIPPSLAVKFRALGRAYPGSAAHRARRRRPRRSRRPTRTPCPRAGSSGKSSRSGSLRRGASTRLTPARCAASAFSFRPPIGSTSPVSVSSPVIAVSSRTGRPVTQRHQRRRHRDARRSGRPWGSRRPARARGCRGSRRSPRAAPSGVRAHVGQRGLRGLLHHVAELAGDRELARAGHRASPRRTARRRRPASTPGPSPRPARRVRRLTSAREARRGRAARAPSARSPRTLRSNVPSATWRATLRQTEPISRSRLRTPASRVYSLDDRLQPGVGERRSASA